MPRRTRDKKPARASDDRRIVAAAREQFFAHGVRGVTMDELAVALGMSKKTLYASYATKADLARAVLLDKFRDVEADLKQIASAPSADLVGQLYQLLAALQRHAEELRPPFWRDIQRDVPDLFQLAESRRQEMIQAYFGKLLRKGRKNGVVRKDIPVDLIIQILIGAANAIVNPARLKELDLTPKSGISAVVAVVFEGVITKKGRA